MKYRVIIFERFCLDTLIQLQAHPALEVIRVDTNDDLRNIDLTTVDALLIRSKTVVNAALLDSMPQLRVIITATSGFDHINLSEVQKRNVVAMYTPDANVISAAELTWALILACVRKVVPADQSLKKGAWLREHLTGGELAYKTLGIVGLGRIGRRVAKYAAAFDMQLLAFDPFIDQDIFTQYHCARVSLDELISLSDIVTLHVPLTKDTEHMLDRTRFKNWHEGAMLINTSRGAVVCEESVCEALRTGLVSYLGLDVFEKEPLAKDSKLLEFSQVVLTPHLGASTEQAFTRASQMAAQKMLNYLLKGEISDSLPPEAQWFNNNFFRL